MEQDFLYSKSHLSKFKSLDKKELLRDLKKYYIEYRDYLMLPRNIEFGLEIEYEKSKRIVIDQKKYKGWISSIDGTLDKGGEIKSPILTDNKRTWHNLEDICSMLRHVNAETIYHAGGHIHFSKDILKDNKKYYINFFKLIILYENILYRFGYGDKLVARDTLDDYAEPIAKRLYMYRKDIKKVQKLERLIEDIIGRSKYKSVSFKNCNFECNNKNGNTIEFRFPNSSTEEVIWQNNINVLSKMLLYSASDDFDKHLIDFRIFRLRHDAFKYENYSEICLKQALEFADLIFDNNLDKINFLKQYIKSEAENSNSRLSKIFVERKNF